MTKKKVSHQSKQMSSIFKFSFGLIIGAILMKYVVGVDAKPLIAILSNSKAITNDAILQALILLIQTLASLPLCLGIGILAVEVLDIIASKAKKQSV